MALLCHLNVIRQCCVIICLLLKIEAIGFIHFLLGTIQLPRTCADVPHVAPPLDVTYCCRGAASYFFPHYQTASLPLTVSMASTVANKCLSPLAFITRRLSAPEVITQCCYHKKVS